jgi:hypothetical protein
LDPAAPTGFDVTAIASAIRSSSPLQFSDLFVVITSALRNGSIMRVDHDRRNAAEQDQNPDHQSHVPKESVKHAHLLGAR